MIPRAVFQGRFLTVDEAYHWYERSAKFLGALRSGEYVNTIFVGHPGVTTVWLGTSGLLGHEWLARLGLAELSNPDARRIMMRLPVAIVTALCVALAFPMLRRLFGGRVALLAALLWAADPFLVAHSKVLHTDALLTSFTTLALLSALVAFRLDDDDAAGAPVRWLFLLASAVLAGLAALTKTPSFILLPLVTLTALVATRYRYVHGGRLAIRPLVAWGCLALAVWWLLWPAAWVDPLRAAGAMYQEAAENGGSPHEKGSFFMGRPVADPGIFFYAVAATLRMTPWMCLGLVAVIVAALRYRQQLPNPIALGVLTLFVLLFTGVMSFLPKKFDRYLLPIFPTLDLLAAVGLVWLAGIVRRSGRSGRVISRSPGAAGWVGIGVLLAANLAWYHPYELAYYNPLLGGGPVASRIVPVGWGEGYEAVGAYLSSLPDACDVAVAVEFHPLLKPYVCNRLISLDRSDKYPEQHFTVLYRDQIQRNNASRVTARLLNEQEPVYVVRKHGVEYAYVYDVKPPVVNAVDAEWGGSLRLRGYEIKTSSVREDGQLTVTWQWEARTPPPAHVFMFVHLLGPNEERLGQLDLPLSDAPNSASGWKAGRVTVWKQQVPMPKDAPQGTYWIALGLYDVRDGRRLPVQVTLPAGAPEDGAHAVFLGPVTLR